MWTISQFARRFGISRSTLLYYDSIGVLAPSARTSAGYRVYDDHDVARMERIDLYRRAGLPLAGIRSILDSEGDSALRDALELRLREIDAEFRGLAMQQRVTLDLLGKSAEAAEERRLDKQGWVAILRASGMDEGDMHRWHVEFERLAPEAHQGFLVSLGINPAEVARIRASSREAGDQPHAGPEPV
ncbi:MAG: MerR family transcriptional regulator [Acidobacteria bacterium]|nr:MerR family transcriptional regulator [Acidobacteriota bacterium]